MCALRLAFPIALLLCAGCGDEPSAPAPERSEEAAASSPQGPLADAALAKALTEAGLDGAQLKAWRRAPEGVILAIPVEAAGAIDAWKRAREHVGDWGRYPVIVDDTDGNFLGYLTDDEPKPGETLAAARELDGVKWLERREKASPDYYGEAELGAWEPGKPQTGFSITHDFEGKAVTGLVLALLPVTESWQAMAWLHFGGWNECPEPEAHVAVHKHWHEKFGAELVCISRDVVEMRVARPVKDREAALELARQQFVYSGGDLVFQGFNSLRALATSLIGAETWYFWWD